MARIRADLLLVSRGLAESRARAQAAIAAGGVTAGGVPVLRASQMLEETAELVLTPPHPWVSRAGLKLAYALDLFGFDPAGRRCLDIGASTGGFTDVLLSRGVAQVTAVDVGHGQFHPRLAADPRVHVREGLDARALTTADVGEGVSLVVCDASFIGLEKILPVPLALAAPAATLIALVKPQYEAGPGRLPRTEAAALEVAQGLAQRLEGLEGFRVLRLADSPIRGGDGQAEYLLHAERP
jgi:23S rRNA (cytidine1920-2'-O)/16S rRNA (cytidine1409-2'-O)-methyltransferase